MPSTFSLSLHKDRSSSIERWRTSTSLALRIHVHLVLRRRQRRTPQASNVPVNQQRLSLQLLFVPSAAHFLPVTKTLSNCMALLHMWCRIEEHVDQVTLCLYPVLTIHVEQTLSAVMWCGQTLPSAKAGQENRTSLVSRRSSAFNKSSC